MTTPSCQTRSGLTLLEVIISLAIFLFAFVAICQVVNLASNWALDAQFNHEGTLLCQSKLAEFTAGSIPLGSVADTSVEEDPNWTWSANCEQVPGVPGLWKVQVQVTYHKPTGEQIVVSMQQMIIDPSYRGSTLDVPPTDQQKVDQNAQDSSGSGTTGTTSGTSGTSGGK